MTTTPTSCSLEELTELEGMRRATLALTARLSDEQLRFSPHERAWSVAQVLDHLVLTLELYTKQFEQVFALAKAGKRPVLHLTLDEINVGFPFVPKVVMPLLSAPLVFMNMFVPASVRQTILRTPLIPASNPTASEPRNRPLADIRADLQGSMDALRQLFDKNAGASFHAMRVLHPVLGDNSVPGLLRVCAAHEERHQKQISGILADSRFPTKSAP